MHEFRQKFDEDFLETAYNNRQLALHQRSIEGDQEIFTSKEYQRRLQNPKIPPPFDCLKCDIYPFKGVCTVTVPVNAKSTSVSTLFLIQNMAI